MNNLYLLRGTLRVNPSGYWYTSGGEKGSFGYYPHLKSADGLPVYPDTQLHGDLRMAALWAKELGADGSIIDRLFGTKGNDLSALLRIGDLTLDEASRGVWTSERFEIKPRIEIDDETRAVKKHMLANFEAAWLDGLTLEAPVYAGYIGSSNELESARQLIDEALPLLSGFGALRSRGYGRGTVTVDWQPAEQNEVTLPDNAPSRVTITLEALTNLRSKPVAAEQLQLVASNLSLGAEQLRGWFVRTYNDLTKEWPSADEMATITFTDCHPSPAGKAAYPPPVTTLRKEDGSSVEDCLGRMPKEDCSSSLSSDVYAADEESREKKIKEKPLKPGSFVTVDGKVHYVRQAARMRNAMEDGAEGGTFNTRKEGGLFVQQYLPAGTCFSGEVSFTAPESAFCRMAHAILTGVRPRINGALFDARLAVSKPLEGSGPLLVTMPLAWKEARKGDEKESLTIGTMRRYAQALGRPRRGRPSIMPGSVLHGDRQHGTVAWPMFGRELTSEKPGEQKPPQPEPHTYSAWVEGMKELVKGISRSQAGNLRELLNPDHNTESIDRYLEDLHQKHYDKKKDSPETNLYAQLCEILEKEKISGLRQKIRELLEYLKAEVWWQAKKAKGGEAR